MYFQFTQGKNERKDCVFSARIIYWTNLIVCVILLFGDPVTPVAVIITSNYQHAPRSLLWNIPCLFHKFYLFLTNARISNFINDNFGYVGKYLVIESNIKKKKKKTRINCVQSTFSYIKLYLKRRIISQAVISKTC